MMIHDYASHGDIEGVNRELRRGIIVDCRNEENMTPLGIAAGSPDAGVEMLRLLVDAGADVNAAVGRRTMFPVGLAADSGDLGKLQCLLDAGANVNAASETGYTPLINVLDHLQDNQRILPVVDMLAKHGADLDAVTNYGESPLTKAAEQGLLHVVKYLINAGADVNTADDSGNTPLMIAAQTGQAECVELLLEAGADPGSKNTFNEVALSMASSELVIRKLVQAGENLNDISKEMRRLLTGMGGSGKPEVTREQYLAGRYLRFGRANPEVMNVPYWKEMVRTGINAYQAKIHFDDTENYSKPVWCFDRFGTSFTELPDGRFVQIGGEHEDYYDPDFCIYNDVFVHDRSGNLEIMGYPEDVFPPTDFHSATLVNGFIYLIGRLGYHGTREFGTTPVYRLNCRNWSIQRVQTFGDNPGWIFKLKATLDGPAGIVITGGTICEERDGEEQHVENGHRFRLDLTDMQWCRL